MSDCNKPLLEIKDLKCWLPQGSRMIRAIDSVNLTIVRGETLVLLGESGCGKSMTALAIAQLLPPKAKLGKTSAIYLEGSDLFTLAPVHMRHIRGRKVAMIFQEPMTSLNPVLSIESQLQECLLPKHSQSKQAKKIRCLELLERVGLPNPELILRQFPHELSGGMKQRVMIALALAGEPDLLIADEPTTALDVTIQAQILELLKTLQQQTGMGMLFITHDLGVARKMADTVAVMYAGHLVEQASADTFFEKPLHPYSQALLAALPNRTHRGTRLTAIKGQVPILDHAYQYCRFRERCQAKGHMCDIVAPNWEAVSDSHRVRCHYLDRTETPEVSRGEPPVEMKHDGDLPRLAVEDLAVHYPIRGGFFRRVIDQKIAVQHLSFTIQAGETVALVGESGCGKTSAAKAIMQLQPKASGRVVVNGHATDAVGSRQQTALRRSMQIVFQDPFTSLDPKMSVSDIIAEALRCHGGYPNREQQQLRIDELLTQVGLRPEHRLRYPHEFSGGQRQRLSIARALAIEPSVLILDEPTSALDLSVQAQILNLLRDLQQKLGLAYLFITHNISLVAYFADKLLVMRAGEVVESGAAMTVLERPQHEYTKQLLAAIPEGHRLQGSG